MLTDTWSILCAKRLRWAKNALEEEQLREWDEIGRWDVEIIIIPRNQLKEPRIKLQKVTIEVRARVSAVGEKIKNVEFKKFSL